MQKSPLYFHIIILVFFWLFPFFSTTLFSQKKNSSVHNSWEIKPFERKAFIENKGQFESYLPSGKKDFTYCIDKGYQVFFYQNEITYLFTKHARSKGTILNIFETEEKREERKHNFNTETQFINVKWLNTNPNSTIVVEDKQSTYFSYVVNSKNEKPNTVMCNGYSKLTYKNLYNGIDVEYVFHPVKGIEYSLIVNPGADISQVKMQYSGSNKIVFKDGNIHIPTLAGNIIEHAPLTFYAISNEKISSSFNVNNNIVSFNVSPYLKDQKIIIDPWVVIPGFTPSKAYDNGTDNQGNIYIYGGQPYNFVVEKYPSTGGPPLWSLVNPISPAYYGDMLVEGSGNFYISEAFNISGAHTQKYSPTSAYIWTSTTPGPDFREHWRLALNCTTGKVIVAGGGTLYNSNIAEIDVNTGVLTNIKALNAPDDISGLCVDEIGKSYTHGGMTNKLSFNDVNNNPLNVVLSGYSHSEAATGYNIGISNGYNMMALGGATFLFTSDGSIVKKWDRNTQAFLGSVTIPGGQQNLGSGILADQCNNLFVGASNGVYRFDFNLVQKEYQATTAAVYDIAYALNSDIVACGNGFLTPLPFGRESCGAASIIITSNSCDPEINTVQVIPTQGVPPFSFLWDDGSTASVRSNLTPGFHIVTVRDGDLCNPSFFSETVTISINQNPIVSDQVLTVCSDIASGLTLGDDIDGPSASTYNIITINSNGLISSAGTPLVANGVLNSNLLDDAWTNTTNAAVDVIYTIVPISAIGCEGTPFTVTLTINPEPVVSDQVLTLCSDIACGLTLGGPPGSTYNILSINSNGLIPSAGTPLVANGVLNSTLFNDAWTNITNAPVDVIYTIVPVSAVGCEGTPFTVTLTINPEPIVSDQVLTVCSDVACGLTLGDDIDGPTASTYNITTINSNGLIPSVGSPLVANGVLNSNLFDDAWTNTINAPVDVIYTLVPICAAGCEGTPFTVTLTINPEPIVSNQVLTVCSDVACGLTLGNDIDGPTASTYNITTINSNGLSSSAGLPLVANGVLNSNLIDDAWTNTTNAPVDVIYTIVPVSAAACEGTPFTVSLTINPEPVVSDQVLTVCTDVACGLTLGDDINGPTVSAYNIITINSNGSSSSAGNPLVANGVLNSNLLDDAWTNTTNAPVDIVYTIVPISAIGCEGTPFTVTLTINPEPMVPNQVASVCSEELIGVTLANDPNGPNLQSWNITNISIGSSLVPNSGNVNVGTTISNQYIAGDIYVNSSILGIDVIYTVIPKAVNSCVGTPFTITITVNPLPVFNVFDAVVCADHYVTLTGNPSSYSYSWDHGVSNNVPFIPPYTDTYNVVATNTITGCIQNSSALVTVHPNPISDFTDICGSIPATLTNTSTGAVNYYWDMGDGSPIITSKDISYSYTIMDSMFYNIILIAETEFGCLDTASKIFTPPLLFYVPNTFTPDGDEFNNTFIPVFSNKNKVESIHLLIYNRWGEIVFESENIDFGWDGTYKNRKAQDGIYAWELIFTNNSCKGKKEHIYGAVNLLR
jgi:gliding motility-associated-like protein